MAQTMAVGTGMRRRDGPEKLTGAARYAGDVALPGMLHARLVLSPYASARITRIDTEAARAMPGVAAVYTAEDLSLQGEESGARRLNFLARDRVFFNGQPVAVVLGETEAQAADAAAAVTVEYEAEPVVVDPIQGMSLEAPLVRELPAAGAEEADLHAAVVTAEEEEREDLPANVTNDIHFRRGDVEAGLAEADVVMGGTYKVNYVHQGYLETQTCVVAPEPATGGVTVHTSTQAFFYTRDEVAAALGLAPAQVRVVPMAIGGGFGAKYVLIDPFVASLAMETGRPVRLAYTRSEDFLAANPSPMTIFELKAGTRRDGTLTALQARVIFDTGAYAGSALSIGCLLVGGYYRFPNLDIRGYEVMTNKPGVGAYRAPGAPQASFAIESLIDDLAERLGLDPLDFRIQNAIGEGDLWPDGQPWPRVGFKECLERLREHPLWRGRHALGPGEGVGVGAGAWPGGKGPAAAACRMDPGGTLTISTGVADLTGQSTTFALIAAEAFGIDPSKVRVVMSDTETAPYSPGSGGSQITYTVGKAVLEAAAEARRQTLAIVAQELEAAPDDLEIVDGQVRVKGVPDRAVPLERVARLSTSKYEPVWARGASAQPIIAPGFAVHLAKVRVDPDTGEVTPLEYVAAQDVGHALNPPAVEGQILGGVVQGLGFALWEQMVHDENGQLLTGSFMDYALPKAELVPRIETILVEVPTPDGPFGARIVGEPPIVPVPATIGNAVKAAVGRRLPEIPLTPERVLTALRG
ncbi:MAG: xanthine dehydrogenase family protein molybdopterin-binding subunit [Chloroflexota bacterium]|nr:xanthine dehydrogenase family protein molybdopterin-binding subunit [Chloroflexota bacterium]